MEYTRPPRTGTRPCGHCGRKLPHPIWRRVDHDDYETLCDICGERADANLTAVSAIRQATGIIKIRLAELAGRIVRDGGAR